MLDYEIKKMYEEMELHLIRSMKRNLGRHLTEENEVGFKYPQWQAEKLKELKRYQRENKKIVGRYILGLDEEVSEHLQNELKQGSINAIKQYNKILGDNLKPSKIMNKSFFRTNDRKVNNLIKVVNNDLKTANTSALRMANDQYRQIIHKSAFFVGNGVFTEKQAAARAVDEISEKKLTTLAVDEASKNFLAGGLNCIEYSDGRRVNIASYSQMAIRTASLRSQLMGEGDFRASIGRTLVKVTTHGGACPLCTKWQGKVLVDDVYSGGKADGKHTLLSQAMAQGFLHPNCRHGITTYYPELEEDDDEDIEPVDEEQEEVQQQFNYAVRTAKKYNRLEKGSLDHNNIEKYRILKNKWKEESSGLYDVAKNGYDYSTKEIVADTRKIVSPTLAKRTKGIKISRVAKDYSYFDEDENKIYLGIHADKYSLIHELGHRLFSVLTKEELKEYNRIIKNKFQKYTKSDFKKIKGKTGSYWILKDSSEFVSKYQTRVYNSVFSFKFNKVNTNYTFEYIAEGLTYYYKNPSLLKKKDMDLYKFIDKVVNNE